MYLVFLMYALLALTFPIGKSLVSDVPPIFLIAIRMIIAGTIVSGLWYIFDRKLTIRYKDLPFFIAVVAFHIVIPFTTEYIALQYISPSSACLMYNLSPFISALFSYIIFNEIMTPKKWLGFGIGIIGIGWYFHIQSFFSYGISWPHGVMILSVITSCLGWTLVRLLVKNKGYSTLLINGASMLIGGLIALPLSHFSGEIIHIPLDQLPRITGLLMVMICITNILFYNLYGYLLQRYTATFLSFVGFVTPLFAAFFEWITFGIVMPHEFFMTVIIIGIGIFIFYHEELKQGYVAN